MTQITRQTLDQISEIIRPFALTAQDRQALLTRAFGADDRADRLVSSIDLSSTTSNFTALLVRRLVDYGDFDGQPSLRILLETVRADVGDNIQSDVDALIAQLYGGGGAPSLPEDVALNAPPSGEHVFISYSRADKETVLQFITDIEQRGVRVWVDQSGLTPGTPDWEQALRDAIQGSKAFVLAASPDSRRSVYVKGEIAIAQMYDRPIYPVWVDGDQWADSVTMALIHTQFVDLRGDAYADGIIKIARSLTDVEPLEDGESNDAPQLSTTERDTETRNPYKGLQAFTADDTRYFFGRDKLVGELIGAMDDAERFLPVVGASGSGKSSVVMAGLLPRLRDEHPDWTFLKRVVPGVHPLETLANALSAAIPGSLGTTVLRELREDASNRALHVLASQIGESRVVLFVDQFEELFTLSEPTERNRFVDLLTAAATESNGPLTAILTMRADFMDRPLADGDLARLFQNRAVLMKPMDVSDLRDVIVKPATLQGLTFDENLVGDLLFEVRGESGALPLLEFALEQLYERRDGDRLTRDAYNEIGGVRGAIARQAEATYTALPSERHQQLARTLFLRLIEPGATEQDTTRRRVDRDELTLADAADTVTLAEVATAFTDARLLVSSSDSPHPEGEGPGVRASLEVAHEALIRQWETLGAWMRDAREDLRTQKALNADAAEWTRRGRKPDDSRLYRGEVLAEALDWAERNVPSADEAAFIAASDRYARRRNVFFRSLQVATVMTIAVLVAAIIFIQGRTNDALLAEVAYIQAQVDYAATRQFGISPFEITQTPAAAFIATATAAAITWEPVTETFDGVEMVQVPGGCFFMGSNVSSDEQPVHEVCLDTFWLDKYEVTNEQFEQFEGVAAAPADWDDPQQPRTSVTWFEAYDFCASRGARLPTEAEWEYAARGREGRVYPWGNEFIADNVVYRENSNGQAQSVGSKPNGVSWVGAYDMAGNVWEWVNSLYRDYEYDASDGRENPANRTDVRVLRGGSWNYFDSYLRSADRGRYDPDPSDNDDGFRCARS